MLSDEERIIIFIFFFFSYSRRVKVGICLPGGLLFFFGELGVFDDKDHFFSFLFRSLFFLFLSKKETYRVESNFFYTAK